MKRLLMPRLMITLALSLPLTISLETPDFKLVPDSTSLTISLHGDVTSGEKCGQREALVKFLLTHDCSSSDPTQRQTVPIQTNSDGSFITTLTIANQATDKARSVCSLVLCRDQDRNDCSNAFIQLRKEKSDLSSDLERKVKFCFFRKSISKRGALRTMSKRSPWSEDDLNWLKRSGAQKSTYDLPDHREDLSGKEHQSSSRSFEGGRPRRLWEGAEDEVGWMKRGDQLDRKGEWSYGRLSSEDNPEQKKKWKESDMAWL